MKLHWFLETTWKLKNFAIKSRCTIIIIVFFTWKWLFCWFFFCRLFIIVSVFLKMWKKPYMFSFLSKLETISIVIYSIGYHVPQKKKRQPNGLFSQKLKFIFGIIVPMNAIKQTFAHREIVRFRCDYVFLFIIREMRNFSQQEFDINHHLK